MAPGFVLGMAFPDLSTSFYLVCVFAGGVIIFAVDRGARRRVKEPLTDERIQGIAMRSAWISFRISMVAVMAGGFILVFAFPSTERLRLLGIGAVCATAIQSLIFGVALGFMRSRK